MASISIKNISLSALRLALLPAALLLSSTVMAQEPDTALISSAMKQYAQENAVITNYTQRLEIKYEDGELHAHTTIKKDRLLIGSLSPVMDHYDGVLDAYFDQITHLDAVAYIPKKTGGYRQEHKHSVFQSGASDGISEARVLVTSFTGLTKGSFIRLTAAQDHPDLTAIPLYIPVESYPIMNAVYEVVVPKYVDIKFVMKGENTSIFKQTRDEKNGNYIYRFTAENIPAYKSFEHVPSELYTQPHVLSYISSYRLPGLAKDSVLLSDPAHLYKSQYKFINNLNVKQDTSLQKIVAEVTKGDVTQRQKAEHIYQWVQKNVHYVAFEIGLGGWIPREADTVCKKMYGDCKDMSSILMTMCHMAGIDAHFTWIGTTLKPYTFEETPVPMVSNHMICALHLDNEWVFIDGTHFNLPFATNRDDIQGKEAMIAIDRDHYKIVTIPVVPAEKNVTVDSSFIRMSDKNSSTLEGEFKAKYVGYPAWNLGFVLGYETKDKEETEKLVEKLTTRGSDKYDLGKYKLTTSEKGNRDVSINGNFDVEGYVHNIGKDYIVNMNLTRFMEDEHIDTTDRKAAWYFKYKNIVKEVVVLDVPAGYKVTYLPKNAQGKLDDMWSYKITYKSDGKKITQTREYTINTMSISPRYFNEHNKVVDELEKQYKESVVLTAK